jgi:hypothetical protein
VLANTLVPVVSTAHLVVWRLISIPTNRAHTLGPQEPHELSKGSSMTRSTRVALRDPRGASTIPLTSFFGATHNLLACFDGATSHQAI